MLEKCIATIAFEHRMIHFFSSIRCAMPTCRAPAHPAPETEMVRPHNSPRNRHFNTYGASPIRRDMLVSMLMTPMTKNAGR